MNERLKELARQAKPNPNLIWEDAELERFAELVRQDYLRELKALKPVAWILNADFVKGQFVEGRVRRVWWECNTGVGQPLYTAPPRKEWVGLTDGEIENVWQGMKNAGCNDHKTFSYVIQSRLKEKNI
jgi:hypothetical protein